MLIDECEALIEKADANGDGDINYEEFVTLLLYKQTPGDKSPVFSSFRAPSFRGIQHGLFATFIGKFIFLIGMACFATYVICLYT